METPSDGETFLQYYWNYARRKSQKDTFDEQSQSSKTNSLHAVTADPITGSLPTELPERPDSVDVEAVLLLADGGVALLHLGHVRLLVGFPGSKTKVF